MRKVTAPEAGTEKAFAPHRSGRNQADRPTEESYGFTARSEMLFTPNFLLAPIALAERNR
jgi:hypothetical protein